MENKILRYRANMGRIDLIDQCLDFIGAPDCGNPFCGHKIGAITIDTEKIYWLRNDPDRPEDGVLTCGLCGNFTGESLQDLQAGNIVEL